LISLPVIKIMSVRYLRFSNIFRSFHVSDLKDFLSRVSEYLYFLNHKDFFMLISVFQILPFNIIKDLSTPSWCFKIFLSEKLGLAIAATWK
jgi:hypothetical protein